MVDVTPLRASREFRLLYGGQVGSTIGNQLTMVAAPYQVYLLTGSSLAVGLLGLVQLPPLIIGSLIGGALADEHDRRRLLLAAQLLLAATTAGLAINAMLSSPRVWAIYLLTAAHAAFSGLDHPTRSSAIPHLVERTQLAGALALTQLTWQLGLVVGPSLAGVVIARGGIPAAYWLDVVSFGTAVASLLVMRPILPEGGGTRASLNSIVEGVTFLKGRRALQATFVIDINAMVFGMPRALFPALGTTQFAGGATAVGLLYAAPGAGALAGALFSGWVTRIDRQGRAVVLAVLIWGAAIAVFGLVPWLPLALALLAVAGAAD
ncbi:MAG: MFS transporter, partial [Acidimicrobiales bacterium]|nr:MFS transporter [Acidimicrobiales bacterium]